MLLKYTSRSLILPRTTCRSLTFRRGHAEVEYIQSEVPVSFSAGVAKGICRITKWTCITFRRRFAEVGRSAAILPLALPTSRPNSDFRQRSLPTYE